MDLEEFRAFLAVVETGSFLAAATALNVARATLRRRVDSLESRAGVPLLERSSKGIALTEAGAILAERGRLVMQEASALLQSVREVGRDPVGVLRVIIPVGLAPHGLLPAFAALRGAYPRLSLHLRVAADPLAEPLDEVDIVTFFGPDAPAGAWGIYRMATFREWLVASPEYLRRRGAPATIDALAGHELLAWSPPGDDGRVWPTRRGRPLEVEPALVSSDVHMIRHAALAGLGIALLPDAMLPDPGFPAGALVPVLEEIVGGERDLLVAVPAALAETPKMRAIIRHLQALSALQLGARPPAPTSVPRPSHPRRGRRGRPP